MLPIKGYVYLIPPPSVYKLLSLPSLTIAPYAITRLVVFLLDLDPADDEFTLNLVSVSLMYSDSSGMAIVLTF